MAAPMSLKAIGVRGTAQQAGSQQRSVHGAHSSNTLASHDHKRRARNIASGSRRLRDATGLQMKG